MHEYYKHLLWIKSTQEKLIESGIIRAVEALSDELSAKVENGTLTIQNIRSLHSKLGECLTSLEKAQAEIQVAQKNFDEYKNKE